MLFTQFEFPVFFAVVLIVAWLCRRRQTRNFVLLGASYYFYAYWDYRFCSLLALSTLVDYSIATHGLCFSVVRRALLLLSLGVILAFSVFSRLHSTQPSALRRLV